ncbi:hypothetical protein MEX01_41500 [Methylorubrum extorquens]|nr:hypothetical protein MEX01_41500 [Methylorubrum extorquens]
MVMPGSIARPIAASVSATMRPICFSPANSSSFDTVMSRPFARSGAGIPVPAFAEKPKLPPDGSATFGRFREAIGVARTIAMPA